MYTVVLIDGFIYYYSGGRTSWTQIKTIGMYRTTPEYVKLAGDTDE